MDLKLKTSVEDLLSYKDAIQETRDQLDYLQEQYDQTKADILAQYEDVIDTDTATISKRVTDDVKIVDAKAVITWLKRNKIDPNNFMKLDTVAVKPTLKTAVYKQRKSVNGTEKTHNETLVITYKA